MGRWGGYGVDGCMRRTCGRWDFKARTIGGTPRDYKQFEVIAKVYGTLAYSLFHRLELLCLNLTEPNVSYSMSRRHGAEHFFPTPLRC